MTAALDAGDQRPTHQAGRSRWVPRLLHDTAFRRYWSGQTISLFGDQITLLALPLLAVLGANAGPAQMGYLTAAELVPSLLLSLLAGAWADRRAYKRRIMIVADVGRAVLLFAIPLLYLLDALTLTHLYVVAFLIGTLSVLFEVCRTTLFVSLVSKDDYIAASSLLNGARAMSFVAGPSVGGVLVQVLSAPIALVVDGLSFLYSAVLLGRIRPVEPPPSTSPGLGLGEGLRFIGRSPVMRSMLASSTTLNLFNYMFHALVVLYAVRYLHMTPGVLGLVIGMASIGALIGAAVTGRLVGRFGIGPVFVFSYVLFPAPLLLIPLAGGDQAVIIAMFFAAEFLAAMGVMMLDIVAGSIMAATIPDDLRARVAGAHRTINYGIRPIGALIGGALGAAIGVQPALWIATAGALTGVLWLLPSPIPRMRRL